MPSFDRLASASSGMLHGVTSFHDDATPTWGLSQSSSVMPIARSMARAPAFWNPSVTSRDRGFMSLLIRRGYVLPLGTVHADGPDRRRPLLRGGAKGRPHRPGCHRGAARVLRRHAAGRWPRARPHVVVALAPT